MTVPYRKYRLRLTLLAIAILLAVLVGTQAAVLAIGRKDAVAQLEAAAKGVAVSVAHTLELDQEGYREFARTKDTSSAYYKRMHHLLEVVRHDTDGVRYIDTESRLDADTTEFVLDSEPEDSKWFAHPGDTNRNDPHKDEVFTHGASVTYGGTVQTVNKRGRMIEAYAPIHGEGGEILGAVGVDIEGKRVFGQFRSTIITLAVADLVFACLLALSIYYCSDRVLGYLFLGGLAGTDRSPAGRRRGLTLMMIELDVPGVAGLNRGLRERALAVVSEIIRGSIRPEDSMVRLGRKGFAVVMADQSPKNAVEVAERMRTGFEDTQVFGEDENVSVKMTMSIGVAVGGPAQTAEDLMGNAERALAQSKAKGGPIVVLGAEGRLSA